MGRVTLNLGLRYDWFIGETQESEVLAEPLQRRARTFGEVRRRQERPDEPAASARCRTGRTSRRASASRWTCSATAGRRIKASVARYVAGQQIAVANAGQPGRPRSA